MQVKLVRLYKLSERKSLHVGVQKQVRKLLRKEKCHNFKMTIEYFIFKFLSRKTEGLFWNLKKGKQSETWIVIAQKNYWQIPTIVWKPISQSTNKPFLCHCQENMAVVSRNWSNLYLFKDPHIFRFQIPLFNNVFNTSILPESQNIHPPWIILIYSIG